MECGEVPGVATLRRAVVRRWTATGGHNQELITKVRGGLGDQMTLRLQHRWHAFYRMSVIGRALRGQAWPWTEHTNSTRRVARAAAPRGASLRPRFGKLSLHC